MGLYLHPFEEWDRLLPQAQMWIALCALIQESFQHCLNAMAPTTGHQGYAPALPQQQNAFGALAKADTYGNSVEMVATKVAALMYQSQLTASIAANSSQRQEQQLAHLASQQKLMHKNMHQLISGLNAVTFNVSNKRCRVGQFASCGSYGGGYRGHSCGCSRPGPR
jgi:hypothetical protein